MIYEIRVEGHVDHDWSDWFAPSAGQKNRQSLTHLPNGETIIIGHLADQSALRGVLTRIWDLGLSLKSVILVEKDSVS